MTEQLAQLSGISFNRDAIANHWHEAILPLVPALDPAEVKAHLAVWIQEATALLLTQSFEREDAQAIGAALARDISPDAHVLGRTQEVLARQIVEGLSADQIAALQPRLSGLLGELAIGFVQERESLVRSMRAQFLSTTGHELRSPLNAIIGFSRVVLKEVDGPVTDLQEQDLTAVYEAGKRLLDLINDTFNIEKIEVGAVELEPKTFDLEPLVAAALAEAEPIAEEHGNTLEVHYATKPGSIHSDPAKIKLVLTNLLTHATRFTRLGVIRLTASRDTVDGVDWVRFQIADTGIGMTPDQVARFVQAGDPNTLKYSDIGLTVSQRYCRMLGGHIAVESAVGKGTTFTVSLPAHFGQTSEALE